MKIKDFKLIWSLGAIGTAYQKKYREEETGQISVEKMGVKMAPVAEPIESIVPDSHL